MSTPPIGAASLACDNCGRTTPHRILRLDRGADRPGASLRGVARCQVCRFTHPFVAPVPDEVERDLIVSSGAETSRRRIRLAANAQLQVGGTVPGLDAPMTIRRLDAPGRPDAAQTPAAEVRTIWAVRDDGAIVRVSLVEGSRTRSAVVRLPHGTVLEVGSELDVEGRRAAIVALRAAGQTWRRPGDRFPADQVQRAYTRRTTMPPAGRRDWSRSRGRPTSVARATSTAARSRSSPGTRVARRVPRARSADGGADDQSASPS